ncbi:MAG: metallophosphoesterase [Verrucomicrobiae bacterium]|nr:metallophosphoesterase [Verrucomicrobiae bacterium]
MAAYGVQRLKESVACATCERFAVRIMFRVLNRNAVFRTMGLHLKIALGLYLCLIPRGMLISGEERKERQVGVQYAAANSETWEKLCAQADKHVVEIESGKSLSLKACDGILVANGDEAHGVELAGEEVEVPKDGFLTFALNAKDALYVTGSVTLAPSSDLRPGLRATILCDDTLVGAPMVRASPWKGIGSDWFTGPAPDIEGERPDEQVELHQWLLPKGRHYLRIEGPLFRSAGIFKGVELRSLDRSVSTAIYTFALFADTHIQEKRAAPREWMNNIMGGKTASEFASTLALLQKEGLAFAFLIGDMVNTGRAEQFQELAQAISVTGLPVYACIGSHDCSGDGGPSRAIEFMPDSFPGKSCFYDLDREPLRFIVMDSEHLYGEQVEWLRRKLAENLVVPTIVMWHTPFRCRPNPTSCGFMVPDWSFFGKKIPSILESTANVIATFSGHGHWNAVFPERGITNIQIAAFGEWPNVYGVFRVYQDRLEWELRQVHSRAFVHQSFVVPKALSWMISTFGNDLGGMIPFKQDHLGRGLGVCR